ncbi:MAG: ribonuclease Z [Candidatus Cloacimonetes bacterium]|nr:ribonuclease Z [Candidatus Cloacimonadota bacterium]
MQVKILGSGTGLPVLGKGQAAILAEIYGRNFLFDCGEGTTYKLLHLGCEADFLDFVVISHMHPDHSSGLPMLIQMLYLQKRRKTLKIYLPERVDEFRRMLHNFYIFEDKLGFTLELISIEEVTVDFPGIRIFPNSHLEGYSRIIKENGFKNMMKSFSFVIEDGTSKVVYTSDIPDLKHLCNYVNNADVFIVDAIHLPVEELKCALSKSHKRIILNHGLSDEIKEYLENNKISGVEIAQESEDLL